MKKSYTFYNNLLGVYLQIVTDSIEEAQSKAEAKFKKLFEEKEKEILAR